MQYLREYRNALSKELCEEIIQRFEDDPRKGPGVVGLGYNPEVKQSTDLKISGLEEWLDIDNKLLACLNELVPRYIEEVISPCTWLLIEPFDTGYQIQRTDPGGFFDWHHDTDCFRYNRQYSRSVTYLWYLNDIQEGGTTEFITGEHIKPEAGKLLLFPATWTFAHRGNPPVRETKYICTGWIYSKYYLDEDVQQQVIDATKEKYSQP